MPARLPDEKHNNSKNKNSCNNKTLSKTFIANAALLRWMACETAKKKCRVCKAAEEREEKRSNAAGTVNNKSIK